MSWIDRHLKNKQYLLDIKELRSFCIKRWPKELGTIHGIEHWDRVARFGKMLYQEGADMEVVMAFAYLHDSQRINNGYDIDHGKRASSFIDSIRHTKLTSLNNVQIEKLKKACELHTIKHKTGDLTIDICFDADRMDLLRVGIIPIPRKMATQKGAELVADPSYQEFYEHLIKESLPPSDPGSGTYSSPSE